MKKSILTLVLVLLVVFKISAVQTFDTVILLDTSESMFPYFDSSVEYLIQDIIKNQLKAGDTFHLLTFADSPEYEISRKIKNRDDIESILSRILLLQPLGKYTDLVSALVYLNSYANELSPETLKKIIILTDGIHDPPPNVKTYSNKSIVLEKIKNITENMKRQGWDVSLIRFPLQQKAGEAGGNEAGNNSGLGGMDIFPELSKELGSKIIDYDSNNTAFSHKATGAPEVEFPGDLGEVKYSFEVPFIIRNFSSEPVQIKLKRLLWDGKDILNKDVTVIIDPDSSNTLTAEVVIPDDTVAKHYSIPVELVFSDDIRPYPRKGTLSFTLASMGSSTDLSGVMKIILFILLIAAVLALIIYIIKLLSARSYQYESRSTGKSATRGPLEKTAKAADLHRERPKYTIHSPREIENLAGKSESRHNTRNPDEKAFEMIVQNQNRHIGMRNIHWFKEGAVYSLGGNHSDDFIIFIHPVGKHAAEIEMRGNKLYLKVLKREFFNDIQDVEIIPGKNVVMKSSDSALFTIRFKEWISPAKRINRILHLIDKPGLPDFRY